MHVCRKILSEKGQCIFWNEQQTLSLLPLNCPCRTIEVNNTWNDSQQPITFIVFYVLTLYWKGKVRSNLRSMVITPRAQWGNKSVWQTRNWTGQLIVSSDLTLSREHAPGMKEKTNDVQQREKGHNWKTSIMAQS